MNRQTLKEQLKPPFVRIGRMIFDSSPDKKLLFEVPDFLFCEDTEKALDFTVVALNEKWENVFGELERWIQDEGEEGYFLECPYCEYDIGFNVNDSLYYPYCPYCGQRLLPPAAEKENQ